MSIVLLAAGQSVRMVGRHKLLLDVGGEPLIRRSALAALALEPEELVIVTGHEQSAVQAALSGLPLRFVFNREYASGQPSSVAAGVTTLTQWCDAVMVMPGDLPLIETDDLRFLCSAYRVMERGSIAVPFFKGVRGNPILFSASHVAEVASGRTNVGCRKLIENNPDLVSMIEVQNDHFVLDMDTPEDYERVVRRLGVLE
ncbi:MAG: nucleotidyltransferase family protein [Polaromonas sp.]